jgi:hypothetical protein
VYFLFFFAFFRYALHNRANLQKGETILILGASGGVGSAAIEVYILLFFLGEHGARDFFLAPNNKTTVVVLLFGANKNCFGAKKNGAILMIVVFVFLAPKKFDN